MNRLSDEYDAILHGLNKVEGAKLCEVIDRFNIRVSEIINVFQKQKYANRIVVFHFSGHAGDFKLELGDTTIEGHAFNDFLKKNASLRLVFLNGCSTNEQAEALLELGIPAIIATLDVIPDNIAKEFAAAFYNGLAERKSIKEAFEEAELAIMSDVAMSEQATRALGFLHAHASASDKLWKLYAKDEDAENWKLEDEIDNPYLGLPKPENYHLPKAPYISLKPYTEKEFAIFWGRGNDIKELYFRVKDEQANPVILLYGQTGVGKSSLLDAGLVPYLKMTTNVFYTRRIPELGLMKTLQRVLKCKFDDPDDIFEFLATPISGETVIIIDQLEEVFTKPIKSLPEELNDFIALLNRIVDSPEHRAIKFILGYRKEYHAEIEAVCGNLPFSSYFLQPLEKKHLISVVKGINSFEAARKQYNVQIEPGLPELIADDLYKDPDSPVAPVLQILLAKLWEKSAVENTLKRTFSKKLYYELKDKGLALSDFVNEKIKEFEAFNKDAVESGLLYDLLYFHITPMDTAATNELSKIHERYDDVKLMDEMILKCKELYLLVDTKGTKDQVSVTHDTLAPIIRLLFTSSVKPGQKANQILTNRQLYDSTDYLSERDLSVVKLGKKGMRKWNEAEEKLIAFSEIKRKQHERQKVIIKYALRILGFFISVSLGVVIFLYNKSVTTAKRSKILYLSSEAAKMKDSDPTQALRLLMAADSLSGDNEVVWENIYAIYDKLTEAPLCVKDIYTSFRDPEFNISPDKKYLLLFNAKKGRGNSTKAYLTDIDGKIMDTIQYEGKPVLNSVFVPGEEKIITQYGDFSTKDKSKPITRSIVVITDYHGAILNKFEYESDIEECYVSPDGKMLVTGEWNSSLSTNGYGYGYFVVVRDLSNGKEFSRRKVKYNFVRLRWHPNENKVLAASWDSIVLLNLTEGTSVAKRMVFPYNVGFSSDGKYFMGSEVHSGKSFFWTVEGKAVASIPTSLVWPNYLPGLDTLIWTSLNDRHDDDDMSNWAKACLYVKELNRILFAPVGKRGITVYDTLGNSMAVTEMDQIIKSVRLLNNNTLITATSNHIRFWNIRQNRMSLPAGRWYWNKTSLYGIDGKELITGSNEKTKLSFPDKILSIVYSDNDRVVFTGILHDEFDYDRDTIPDSTRIHFVRNNKIERSVEMIGFAITSAVKKPFSDEVLTVCSDRKARVIDANGKIKLALSYEDKHHPDFDYITHAEYSKSGDTIIASTAIGYIVRWNKEGKPLDTLDFAIAMDDLPTENRASARENTFFCTSADGKKIAAFASQSFFNIYNLFTGKIDTLFSEKGGVKYPDINSAQFIENDKYLITQGDEGLNLWNLVTKEMILHIKCKPTGFDVSPDGSSMIINQADKPSIIYLLPKGIKQWVKSLEMAPLSEDNRKKYGLN